MGFKVEHKENNQRYGLIKFIFEEPFVTEDMNKVLAIISGLLDVKKPFAFYMDTRGANNPPLNAAAILIKWMKANRSRFKEYLICSAVIYNNTLTNNVVSKLMNGVFVIQPPVCPNKLSSNMDGAEKWMNEKIQEYVKKRFT